MSASDDSKLVQRHDEALLVWKTGDLETARKTFEQNASDYLSRYSASDERAQQAIRYACAASMISGTFRDTYRLLLGEPSDLEPPEPLLPGLLLGPDTTLDRLAGDLLESSELVLLAHSLNAVERDVVSGSRKSTVTVSYWCSLSANANDPFSEFTCEASNHVDECAGLSRDMSDISVSEDPLRQYFDPDGRHISIYLGAGYMIREEPWESAMRAAVMEVLLTTPGVENAWEEDREIWIVKGTVELVDVVTALHARFLHGPVRPQLIEYSQRYD